MRRTGRAYRARIAVCFELRCPTAVAWQQVHRPSIAEALYRPLFAMRPLTGTLPAVFTHGSSVTVQLWLCGIIPVGVQRITIADLPPTPDAPGAHTMRDHGGPVRGPLAILTGWNHEITVTPTRRGTTIWYDELRITGPAAPLFRLGLAPLWAWPQHKLRRLARTWQAAPSDPRHGQN